MVKVLIADDHTLFREGLKRILEQTPGMTITGEAATGEEAIQMASKNRPDVVLLDVSMPGRGGIETAQEIKRRSPGVRILMLTVHPEDHFAVRCLKEGADGYMTKDAAPKQLLEAIQKVRSGGKYVSPGLAERLAMSLESGFGRMPHESLSDREFEVMRLIASGKTASEIAAQLHLSVKTISTYRARILEKMSMRTNAEIMHYAFEIGLEK
ncbi:MAG TPA: response regulator transcription factor [Thermoanaerobaculia bacterium]|nr:response regulator transcription factor [Thermoanaerobaculia bacterium]